MRIDADQLAAFAAVIDEGSFDAAARRLHVTPSAVSQRVKALENSVGRVLIQRTRPARATDAGQVLVRLAGQVALLEGEALADVAGGADVDSRRPPPRLPVAVNADSLATWFLPALADMPADQALTFDIRQEDQDHSIALLRDGSVMAAVTTEHRPVQGCRVELLGAMRYRAVAAPDFAHRYLGRPPGGSAPAGWALGGLAVAPALIFNRKDGLQDRFLRDVLGMVGEPPVTYLPSSWGFVEAARRSLGWGMVPEGMARADLEAGDLVDLCPDRPLDVPLYWQRWRLESSALAALTRCVRACTARELIHQPMPTGRASE
ncbi:LysR family transcriptional regulator ArgP [Phytoactinopolyspora limicola]|uniref:LysR family transcriptional regulator ArgP n=1 Tax=Phytoactinopolyspora limicola TaxID=2715536 RepID=UPI00140B256C|nr:LysR family transcriptional regulator ArgP [Phytoactinopolyspora limicola]